MPPKQQPLGKKKPSTEVPQNAIFSLGAFVFVMLAVLWYVTTPGAMHHATTGVVKAYGVKDALAELALGADGRPTLVSKAPLMQGQPVFGIPADAIIDNRAIQQSALGKLIGQDNASVVTEVAQEHRISQGAFNIVSQAMYLALEKRQGSSSRHHALFSALPAPTSAILFWPEEAFQCADAALQGERRELMKVVNVTVALSERLCADDALAAEAGCRNKPITEEEAKWAVAVYLQNNFQDQAVIPFVNFARLDNSKPAIVPQFDQQTNTLMFTAGGPVKRGDELTVAMLRGPNAVLAAHGRFDTEARGVDLALQLPEDEPVKKYCLSQSQELQFAASGKPREGLITCMSVLVVQDPKERRRFAKNVRKNRTPEITAYTYGNLTVAAAQMSRDTVDEAACKAVSATPLVQALREYNAWRIDVMQRNARFLEQKMVESYAAAGIPLPQPPQQEQQPGDADAAEGSAVPLTDSEL